MVHSLRNITGVNIINNTLMKRFLRYLLPIVLCFVVGWISSIFQRDALIEWYPYLNKPSITPPNTLFPIAWSILYICSGLSFGRLWDLGEKRYTGLWFLILALNFLWSPMFFFVESPISGLAIILMLDIAVLSYVLLTWRSSALASILMIPYLAWVCFASYINFYVWLFN